jgi:hypothetical protein
VGGGGVGGGVGGGSGVGKEVTRVVEGESRGDMAAAAAAWATARASANPAGTTFFLVSQVRWKTLGGSACDGRSQQGMKQYEKERERKTERA